MPFRARTFVTLLPLFAACRWDQAAPASSEARQPPAVSALVVEGLGLPCLACVVGPITFERQRGAPVIETVTFTVLPGPFVVDVDDLGSQGGDGAVALNGVTLMASRVGDDIGPRHYSQTFTLGAQNTLEVRLLGKPGSVLRVALWPLMPVTLDAVTLVSGTTLHIDGPGVTFNSTISNRTLIPFTNVFVQAWVEQGAARRAGGGQVVSCQAASGVLPPGACIRVGDGIFASNAAIIAGTGVLVPGPATAVIEVRQHIGLADVVLDSRSVPIALLPAPGQVLSVTVNPAAPLLSIGQTVPLFANVQVTPGAPTTVTWTSSNAAVATVNVSGLVTAVSRGAALVTATSTANLSKYGTALISVATQPSYGNGVNVSPGSWQMGPGATVNLAAQVVGGPSTVLWISSNAAVATVDANGRVTGVSPGTATITAISSTNPAWTGTAAIRVYDFRISAPAFPTNVSTGATTPPANPLSVPISASACGPTVIFSPGIARTDFQLWVGPSSWTTIGSSTVPAVVDNGTTRCWTWTFMWTPGTAFGTGPRSITATAVDSWGGTVAGTPWNILITTTNP